MKIHWGIGLAIVFAVFAIGILIMVRISMNREIDLVSDDYYQRELHHQEQIDIQKRSNGLPEQPSIGVSPTSVIIKLPKTFSPDSTTGVLTFYRPADRHQDFVVSLRLDSSNTQFIPSTSLSKGLWRVKVRWTQHLQSYYHEEALVIQ